MAGVAELACPSCGAQRAEQFCPKCGEKRVGAHDYSISHFVEHSIEGLTHFDLRSLRALRALILRPGELTRSFLDGRRRGYVGPIQLFLILNVVYALLGATTFRTPLFIQEADPPLAATKRAIVASTIARTAVSHEEFAKEFDRNAGVQAKTWIFAMIPMFALCLTVLYGFRRYFFEHLVFAAHFMAFLLIVLMVIGAAVEGGARLAAVRLTMQRFDTVASSATLLLVLVYLFIALRRTYGDRWYAAATRSLLMTVLMFPVIQLYRFLLFFVTLKTMH